MNYNVLYNGLDRRVQLIGSTNLTSWTNVYSMMGLMGKRVMTSIISIRNIGVEAFQYFLLSLKNRCRSFLHSTSQTPPTMLERGWRARGAYSV